MNLSDQRQKGCQALFLKPLRNHLLVSGPGLYRVPVPRFLLNHELRAQRLPDLIAVDDVASPSESHSDHVTLIVPNALMGQDRGEVVRESWPVVTIAAYYLIAKLCKRNLNRGKISPNQWSLPSPVSDTNVLENKDPKGKRRLLYS